MIALDLNSRFQLLKSQYAPSNGSQPFRSVECALEVLLRCEYDQERLNNVQEVTKLFLQSNNPAICNELNPHSLQVFKQIREWLKYFKYGFIQLTNQKRDYHKYDDSNIMEYLISIQPQIDFHNIIESYKSALLNIKNQFSWTQKFIQQWIAQSQHMKHNKIELFKKSQPIKKIIPVSKQTYKRSGTSNSKTQVDTQAGQAPMKKIKQDSANFRAIALAVERVLPFSEENKRRNLQERFNDFKRTQNLQYMQLLDQGTAKRIFEMRSFMKLFLDAITEATENQKYLQFSETGILEKIFSWQGQVDPDNVFQSYKRILDKRQQSLGWPKQMINGILRRVVEFKILETEFLLRR